VLRAAAAGFSPQQIADTVDGVKDARMAAADLRRALADGAALRRVAAGDKTRLLELELTQLAATQRAVEGVMRRAVARQGEGAADDLVLRCSDRLLRLAERRQQLQGLAGGVAPDGQEDELARRRARMQARRKLG
jgi:hypothetical protein